MVLELRPIDYLIVGHVTQDLSPEGPLLGGTVSYAGLTAHALGLRVGILTAAAADVDLSPLMPLQVHRLESVTTSTFENRNTPEGRRQQISARAIDLRIDALPAEWSAVRVVHCAPIANEVDINFTKQRPGQMLGLTPQGWLRQWDQSGIIALDDWSALRPYRNPAAAAVLSQEDLGGTLEAANDLAGLFSILVITMAADGAMVYKGRESRHLPTPSMTEVDATGSGDIFAATFFYCLSEGDDPWTAAAIANQLAARSVTRRGLASIPGSEEIQEALQLRRS